MSNNSKEIKHALPRDVVRQEGPKHAEYPHEFFPVAYRVKITGIWVTNSGWAPGEQGRDLLEIVHDMVEKDQAGISVRRLNDAPLEEWEI